MSDESGIGRTSTSAPHSMQLIGEKMSEFGHGSHALFPAQPGSHYAGKMESTHYRILVDRHHGLFQEIFRIEEGLQAASDGRLEDQKRRPLSPLDTVAAMNMERQAAR